MVPSNKYVCVHIIHVWSFDIVILYDLISHVIQSSLASLSHILKPYKMPKLIGYYSFIMAAGSCDSCVVLQKDQTTKSRLINTPTQVTTKTWMQYKTNRRRNFNALHPTFMCHLGDKYATDAPLYDEKTRACASDWQLRRSADRRCDRCLQVVRTAMCARTRQQTDTCKAGYYLPASLPFAFCADDYSTYIWRIKDWELKLINIYVLLSTIDRRRVLTLHQFMAEFIFQTKK